MFLKWTQVQTRNPLQGNSDFIYSENTKCRYIKCAGRDSGLVHTHASLLRIPLHSPLQPLTLPHTSPLFAHGTLGFMGTGPGKIYIHRDLS